MMVIDSNKTSGAIWVKLLVNLSLMPLIYLWVGGALADHTPHLFAWLHQLDYWGWFLLNALLAIVRNGGPIKWYVKEEK